MRRTLLSLLALTVCALHAEVAPIPLWEPGAMPGDATANAERVVDGLVYDVSVPTLTFHPAPNPEGRPLPTVIVAPGGGYACLAHQHEGIEPARWLNERGLHAAILKYRIPGDRAAALEDAKRAVALLRAHTDDWKVDSARVGMMGFSAGAHLTAHLLAQKGHGLNFAILCYPAYLSGDGITLAPEVVPAEPTVPTFLIQSADDRAYILSSYAYAGHLLRANRPVAYHLFAGGGHGFGFRVGANPELSQWPAALEAWLRANVL